MNTYPEQLKNFSNAVPLAITAVISVLLALGKALSAGHMIVITGVIGFQIGPSPLIALAIVDLVVGVFALAAGVAFVLRRGWGQKALAHGAIPIAAYEIGRALGLAVANVTDLNLLSMLVTVGNAACWVLVAWGALSRASTLYVASRQPS